MITTVFAIFTAVSLAIAAFSLPTPQVAVEPLPIVMATPVTPVTVETLPVVVLPAPEVLVAAPVTPVTVETLAPIVDYALIVVSMAHPDGLTMSVTFDSKNETLMIDDKAYPVTTMHNRNGVIITFDSGEVVDMQCVVETATTCAKSVVMSSNLSALPVSSTMTGFMPKR